MHVAPVAQRLVALNAAEFITHARLILKLHLRCEELKVLTEPQSGSDKQQKKKEKKKKNSGGDGS